MLDVANQHPGLWAACIERGADLDELPATVQARRQFRADVRALARDILRRNEQRALAEMQALGITEDGAVEPASSPIPEAAHLDYLSEIQARADDLVAARFLVSELRQVPVGAAGQHPLMREAYERRLFDPDGPDNIVLLTMREVDGVVPDKGSRESPKACPGTRARRALEAAGIRGVQFLNLPGARAADPPEATQHPSR